MIKKAMVAIVVIVAAAAIVFAAAGSAGHTNSNQGNQQNLSAAGNTSDNVSKNNVNNVSSNISSKKKISPAKAKKIAKKYIKEPGATAGKPVISKTDGRCVYTVPVIQKGKHVGEIDVDARTGKNVGGAGGAPC